VNGHAAIGLHHDQPDRLRKVSGQPTFVVDNATGDYEPHGG